MFRKYTLYLKPVFKSMQSCGKSWQGPHLASKSKWVGETEKADLNNYKYALQAAGRVFAVLKECQFLYDAARCPSWVSVSQQCIADMLSVLSRWRTGGAKISTRRDAAHAEFQWVSIPLFCLDRKLAHKLCQDGAVHASTSTNWKLQNFKTYLFGPYNLPSPWS